MPNHTQLMCKIRNVSVEKKFNLCVKNGPAMRKYILAAKTYTAN